MKIPKETYVKRDGRVVARIEDLATELSAKYGIWVEMCIHMRIKEDQYYAPIYVEAITFKVMDHVFENLHDVEKALNNKAFL